MLALQLVSGVPIIFPQMFEIMIFFTIITVDCCVLETQKKGAMVDRDFKVGDEFWMKSRQIVGELFDCADYQIAYSLLLMAQVESTLKSNVPAAIYYYTLCQSICEQIGAVNSIAYLCAICVLWYIHIYIYGPHVLLPMCVVHVGCCVMCDV